MHGIMDSVDRLHVKLHLYHIIYRGVLQLLSYTSVQDATLRQHVRGCLQAFLLTYQPYMENAGQRVAHVMRVCLDKIAGTFTTQHGLRRLDK